MGMKSKEFKIKMLQLDLNQKTLAEKLGVTEKTINTIANKPEIPLTYQWAIYGLEMAQYTKKGGKL